MMRDGFFLLVSVALHAAMLSYPSVTLRPQFEEAVPVVFVTLDQVTESVEGSAATVEDRRKPAGMAQAPARSQNVGGARDRTRMRQGDLPSGLKQRSARAPGEQHAAQHLESPSQKVQHKEGFGGKPHDHSAIHTGAADAVPRLPEGATTFWEDAGRVLDDLFPRAAATRPTQITQIEDQPAELGGILPGGSGESDPILFARHLSETVDDLVHGGLGVGPTAGAGNGAGSGVTSSTFGQIGEGAGGGPSGSGRGFESGSSNGGDSGYAGERLHFVRVSYAHAPRPEYPERARREGKEGRVLLRVLIDEQGRTQSVQIHETSGSELLDLAALEAIKGWRFWPARYGQQAVQSWVKIPIHFRLSQEKR